METKDTAVALLKEWKSAKDAHSDVAILLQVGLESPNEFSNGLLNVIEHISRRLAEIAEATGITIAHSGEFAYDWDKTKLVNTTPKTCCLDLPAREQQAIQEWLLIKNEEKTA